MGVGEGALEGLGGGYEGLSRRVGRCCGGNHKNGRIPPHHMDVKLHYETNSTESLKMDHSPIPIGLLSTYRRVCSAGFTMGVKSDPYR